MLSLGLSVDENKLLQPNNGSAICRRDSIGPENRDLRRLRNEHGSRALYTRTSKASLSATGAVVTEIEHGRAAPQMAAMTSLLRRRAHKRWIETIERLIRQFPDPP